MGLRYTAILIDLLTYCPASRRAFNLYDRFCLIKNDHLEKIKDNLLRMLVLSLREAICQ
jgi:hypothetical protein